MSRCKSVAGLAFLRSRLGFCRCNRCLGHLVDNPAVAVWTSVAGFAARGFNFWHPWNYQLGFADSGCVLEDRNVILCFVPAPRPTRANRHGTPSVQLVCELVSMCFASQAANGMTSTQLVPESQTGHRRESFGVCTNPNGIAASSPGLRGTSYPGLRTERFSTPTGLRNATQTRPQPRWGCADMDEFPRVARSSQPWAGGRNPVGVQRGMLRKGLGPSRDDAAGAPGARPSGRRNARPQRALRTTRTAYRHSSFGESKKGGPEIRSPYTGSTSLRPEGRAPVVLTAWLRLRPGLRTAVRLTQGVTLSRAGRVLHHSHSLPPILDLDRTLAPLSAQCRHLLFQIGDALCQGLFHRPSFTHLNPARQSPL